MRKLEDCMNARWPTEGIVIKCRKGHQLPPSATTNAVKRGMRMAYKVCQNCPDYDSEIASEEKRGSSRI